MEMLPASERNLINERLLGFDAREQAREWIRLWPAERRELFLLRRDAATPLSTDLLVWPSVFDTGQGIGLLASERERLHLAGLRAPAFTGANAGLWEDAGHLRGYLAEHRGEVRPWVMIAVTWWVDSDAAGAHHFGPYPARTLPATRDPRWPRLGFDVADGSLLSGLSNCGYRPDEAQRLRPQWASRLNDNHLFDDLDAARQFRALTDARVPAHAPFSVYGLYLVDELGYASGQQL